jgi:hypothetical protein
MNSDSDSSRRDQLALVRTDLANERTVPAYSPRHWWWSGPVFR